MKLTEEQIKFLDRVVIPSKIDETFAVWNLNSDGEVDVDGSIQMSGMEMELTEIPVKFGTVNGWVNCSNMKLTTLKNCPRKITGHFAVQNNNLTSLSHHPLNIDGGFYFEGNRLTDYFKSIKEEDFPFWSNRTFWYNILKEYPFLINIGMKYLDKRGLKSILKRNPQLKIYLKN